MKYRKLRATLALLLVLSVFVSFCSLTAFAAGPGSLIDNLTGTWRDSMNEIRAIIIFKESFDPRGGTMPDGSTEAFVVEMPMGIPFRLPAAPEKEGDTFLGWEAVINGETRLFEARQKVNMKEQVEFKARWQSDGDIKPAEADMKLQTRG